MKDNLVFIQVEGNGMFSQVVQDCYIPLMGIRFIITICKNAPEKVCRLEFFKRIYWLTMVKIKRSRQLSQFFAQCFQAFMDEG